MRDITAEDRPPDRSVMAIRPVIEVFDDHPDDCRCTRTAWNGYGTGMVATSHNFKLIIQLEEIWSDLKWDPTISF